MQRWQVYTRGSIPAHRLGAAFLAHCELSTKLFGLPMADVLYINEGSKMWWAWDKQNTRKHYELIRQKFTQPEVITEHFNQHQTLADRAIHAANSLSKRQLSMLTDQELLETYDRFYSESAPAHALMNVDIDVIDIYFEDDLQNLILTNLPSNLSDREKLTLYRQLSKPIVQTYVAKEELETLKAAKKLQEGISIEDDVQRLAEQYWWSRLGWENIELKNHNDFTNTINKYAQFDNLDERIDELTTSLTKLTSERQTILDKYALSETVRSWLMISDHYNHLHDLRKEMQVRTMYEFYRLIDELARRRGWTTADLELLWVDEIRDLLQGGELPADEIKRRKKALVTLLSQNGIESWSGDEALAIHARELPAETHNIPELKGTGVSEGKVIGPAKVCAGAQEALEKVQPGDILVTGMTLPDYVPAMKKAAAIVTNEGGITCHAAIISRELGIPCVVGTRIATQVLQDGQMVEVNATDGVIRIL